MTVPFGGRSLAFSGSGGGCRAGAAGLLVPVGRRRRRAGKRRKKRLVFVSFVASRGTTTIQTYHCAVVVGAVRASNSRTRVERRRANIFGLESESDEKKELGQTRETETTR